MAPKAEIPLKKYLIVAYYQWMLDNGWTIFIEVNTLLNGVRVPSGFSRPDGMITLDISPAAVGSIEFGENEVSFTSRFRTVSHLVTIPYYALKAIFCPHNNKGVIFPEDTVAPQNVSEPEATADSAPKPEERKNKTHLRIIK